MMTRYLKKDGSGRIICDFGDVEDAIKHGCENNVFDGELVYGWDGQLYESASDIPPFPVDLKWSEIRSQRDSLLQQSDWTMVTDAPTDKVAWGLYRQELRDITEQPDPFNIIWPEKP